MRLTQFEINTIKELALLHFGKEVQVYLFGSRVCDNKRGGDIDLFIRSRNGEKLVAYSKVRFITDLLVKIGEQKIDVVLDNPERKGTEFINTIYQTGIRLC